MTEDNFQIKLVESHDIKSPNADIYRMNIFSNGERAVYLRKRGSLTSAVELNYAYTGELDNFWNGITSTADSIRIDPSLYHDWEWSDVKEKARKSSDSRTLKALIGKLRENTSDIGLVPRFATAALALMLFAKSNLTQLYAQDSTTYGIKVDEKSRSSELIKLSNNVNVRYWSRNKSLSEIFGIEYDQISKEGLTRVNIPIEFLNLGLMLGYDGSEKGKLELLAQASPELFFGGGFGKNPKQEVLQGNLKYQSDLLGASLGLVRVNDINTLRGHLSKEFFDKIFLSLSKADKDNFMLIYGLFGDGFSGRGTSTYNSQTSDLVHRILVAPFSKPQLRAFTDVMVKENGDGEVLLDALRFVPPSNFEKDVVTAQITYTHNLKKHKQLIDGELNYNPDVRGNWIGVTFRLNDGQLVNYGLQGGAKLPLETQLDASLTYSVMTKKPTESFRLRKNIIF